MPLTRYERGVIEDLINRVIDQQNAIIEIQKDIVTLKTTVENLAGNNLLSLSTDEQVAAIEEAVKKIIKKQPIKKHTHLTNQEGGDAFAKKGASLID